MKKNNSDLKELNYFEEENSQDFSFDEEKNLLIEKNNKNKELLIDKITNKAFFTKYPLCCLLCMTLIFLSFGMEICLVVIILIPLKQKFSLSEKTLELIVSFHFLGLILGSGVSSYFSNKYGRAISIKIFLLLLTIAHFIMCKFFFIPIFITCRLFVGFFFGIIIPLSVNLFAEYQPVKYRCFCLMLLWAFFGIGQTFENLLALLVMPELQEEKLKLFISLLTVLPLTAFIINFFYLNDSPRHLIISDSYGSLNKALDILNSMNKEKLSSEEMIKLVDEVKNIPSNKEIEGKFSDLFTKKYLKQTLVLLFILFVSSCDIYGIFMISELVMQKIIQLENKTEKDYSNKDVIINQIMIALTTIIANPLGGLMGEIKFLGRKGVIILFSALTSFFIIPIPFSVLLFQIFMPLSTGTSDIFGDLVFNYGVEVYPTRLRDISTSTLYSADNIFNFISQYIFFGLYTINYKLPYFASFILTLISVVFGYFLTYEVKGKALDE